MPRSSDFGGPASTKFSAGWWNTPTPIPPQELPCKTYHQLPSPKKNEPLQPKMFPRIAVTEILHQLVGGLSHDLLGFNIPHNLITIHQITIYQMVDCPMKSHWIIIINPYLEVSWNRGAPSHHPNFDGISHYKPSIFGYPHLSSVQPPVGWWLVRGLYNPSYWGL